MYCCQAWVLKNNEGFLLFGLPGTLSSIGSQFQWLPVVEEKRRVKTDGENNMTKSSDCEAVEETINGIRICVGAVESSLIISA